MTTTVIVTQYLTKTDTFVCLKNSLESLLELFLFKTVQYYKNTRFY